MSVKPLKLFDYSGLPRNNNLLRFSRELRKQGILSEVLVWKALKNRDYICGYDVDRQIIIGNYIVDFYIAELGLVIEIDGSTHDYKYDQDVARDKVLEGYGLEVIRVLHVDCLKNMDGVMIYIQKAVEGRISELVEIRAEVK
jgi:very-short-patch-repair endonuclease